MRSRKYYLIAGLALLALLLRFVFLDRKPAMHDESMFAYYAWQGMQPGAHYVHQAILHGPVQMLGIAQFFEWFGESLGSARASIACWSVLMAAMGLLLVPARHRWYWAALWFTSPIIVYYSRYLHEELIFNGAFLAGMVGLSRASRRNPLAILGLLLALMGCIFLVAGVGVATALSAGAQSSLGATQCHVLGGSLIAAGAVLGARGLGRRLSRGLWACLGAIGMFFPLAVKENALFVYAAGLTFALAWIAVRYGWRGPVPGLAWPRPRRKPQPARPLATKRGKSDRHPSRQRGRKYMHPKFEEVVTESARPNPEVAARAAAQAHPAWSARWDLHLPWPALAVLWTVGLLGAIWIVTWIYGVTRPDSQPDWPLARIAGGAARNVLDSWHYWLGQHEIHRIEGPIDYYVPILALYELPVLLLLYGGLVWDASRRQQRWLLHLAALGAWAVLFGIWHLLAPHLGPENILIRTAKFLHMRPNDQMFFLGVLIVPLLTWSILCLKQHLWLAAWTGWWSACSLFQYSSAGEKVPWLVVNIVVPMYLMLAWVWAPHLEYIGPRFRRALVIFVGFAFLMALRNDYWLIRKPLPGQPRRPHAASPFERLVYNHTPWEFDRIARESLAKWQADPDRTLKQRRVYLGGQAGWPGIWYFRNCLYDARPDPLASMEPHWDLVIGDRELIQPALATLDLDRYATRELSLRDHWLTSPPRQDVFSSLWKYYWLRVPWEAGFTTWPLIAIEPTGR